MQLRLSMQDVLQIIFKEKNKKFSLKMNLKKTEEIGKFSCLNNKKLIYISGAIVYLRQKRTNSENSKIKKN